MPKTSQALSYIRCSWAAGCLTIRLSALGKKTSRGGTFTSVTPNVKKTPTINKIIQKEEKKKKKKRRKGTEKEIRLILSLQNLNKIQEKENIYIRYSKWNATIKGRTYDNNYSKHIENQYKDNHWAITQKTSYVITITINPTQNTYRHKRESNLCLSTQKSTHLLNIT